MKKDLIEKIGNDFFTDSQLVAKKFGLEHKKVIRTIKRLLARQEKLSRTDGPPQNQFKIIKEERNYNGQGFEAYKMNKRFFMLLSMRFENKTALRWQIQFIERFEQNERLRIIAETNQTNELWFSERKETKSSRLALTDTIDCFIRYAMECDSKGASNYFGAFTRLSYDVLGVQFNTKNVRDTLTPKQLAKLAKIEDRISDIILGCMSIGTPYKQIFKNVKSAIRNEFQR